MAYICLFLFSGKGNKMNIVRRIAAVLLSLLMIVGITTQSVSAASYKMEWHGKSTAYGYTKAESPAQIRHTAASLDGSCAQNQTPAFPVAHQELFV